MRPNRFRRFRQWRWDRRRFGRSHLPTALALPDHTPNWQGLQAQTQAQPQALALQRSGRNLRRWCATGHLLLVLPPALVAMVQAAAQRGQETACYSVQLGQRRYWWARRHHPQWCDQCIPAR